MNARTRLAIGAALLAVGAATFWVAATQGQADVRQVADVVAAPAAHLSGAFTLVGVPQPDAVPVTTPQGVRLEANPEWSNETRRTVTWTAGDGTRLYSAHTLGATAGPDGALVWSFRNETRRLPTDTQLALPPVTAQWTLGRGGQAFPVDGFGTEGVPRIWAFYDRAPDHPMQPKPSQFKGHLLAALPDGSALPEGALVWVVEEYTAGCSSKFLPPEAQEKYADTPGA